jgi:hypothetical protein
MLVSPAKGTLSFMPRVRWQALIKKEEAMRCAVNRILTDTLVGWAGTVRCLRHPFGNSSRG